MAKRIFFYLLLWCFSFFVFANDSKKISEIKSPHHIIAKSDEESNCSIFVQMNRKTGALYLFGGISDSALIKYVKLLNAEFYEDDTIDRRILTEWMNSKVATAIKIETDDDDLLTGALAFLVSSTLQFELIELEDDVYIYEINTSLSKYFE